MISIVNSKQNTDDSKLLTSKNQTIEEPRLAWVLLIDTSGSMNQDNAIDEFTNALNKCIEQATKDPVSARQKIHDEEKKGMRAKFKFWAIGTPGYDKEILKSITKCSLEQYDYNFKTLFDWIGSCWFPVQQESYVPTELPKNMKLLMNAKW